MTNIKNIKEELFMMKQPERRLFCALAVFILQFIPKMLPNARVVCNQHFLQQLHPSDPTIKGCAFPYVLPCIGPWKYWQVHQFPVCRIMFPVNWRLYKMWVMTRSLKEYPKKSLTTWSISYYSYWVISSQSANYIDFNLIFLSEKSTCWLLHRNDF